MSNRKLVAALACRVGGSRLYGKPIQNLDVKNNISILDHLIFGLKATKDIDEIVLGIAEGGENQIFVEYAHKHNISYVFGSMNDVLFRLIQCGRISSATDIFRITSECPFISWELLDLAWNMHLKNKNDVTVTDYMPEGVNFEIYTQKALEISHKKGNEFERSEFCSAYVRKNSGEFKIEIIEPNNSLRRLDLRLTVDHPEDLVLCRSIYENFKNKAPHIPIQDIINWIDSNAQLHKLVEPFVDQTPLWASVLNNE